MSKEPIVIDSDLKSKLEELNEMGVILESVDKRIETLNELRNMICDFTEDRKVSDYEKVFKALGSVTRLSILQLILSGVKCSCEIEKILDLSQSTVSHHLKILSEAKIIKLEKTGKWSFASPTINKKFSKELFLDLFESILD